MNDDVRNGSRNDHVRNEARPVEGWRRASWLRPSSLVSFDGHTSGVPAMRVFISSVRRGLDEERDALPGLISALGHIPVRFEDFTAQAVPSRQTCMDAVSSSDVCFLLLGPAYGDRMPDTGVSPTQEEFNVARSRGIPLYAFVKRGVDADADQQGFVAEVERYATGRFRAAFDGATDLLTAVAAVLRQHEAAPTSLTWEPLRGATPAVPWVAAADNRQQYAGRSATVEVHVLPLSPTSRLAVRQLDALAGVLAARGREQGLFTQAQPVDADTDGSAAWARSRLADAKSRAGNRRLPGHS